MVFRKDRSGQKEHTLKKIFMLNIPPEKKKVIHNIGDAIGSYVYDITDGCLDMKVGDLEAHPDPEGIPRSVSGYSGYGMEMLVISGLSSRELDIFLDRYNKTGQPPVQLKSVVTDTNREWTVKQLYSELAKEYLFYKMHSR